ncbi:pancreatic lipase-related protein 2-like [Culex pipiens pallens]|uniref:pancreatic lipase-related protein 2-like n=1 Tax=Culex pipiens pallens TaxID=42434 RepID=UPI0019547EA1|nr:pancreatic lipase-related protein 2-like [Culex pipiens pallens]
MAQRLMNGARLWAICVVICVICGGVKAADRVTGTIRFLMFDRDSNQLVNVPDNNAAFAKSSCKPSEQFAIIVHGWREGTDTEWVGDMVSNFTVHRPGCVMVMHYANNSHTIDYFGELLPHFDKLANVLAAHLRRMESIGFDPAKGHIFGFSMGAQLALEGSRRFGLQKINRIDACDPAGPGFDTVPENMLLDPKQAARQVQCIHTSANFGTRRRDCHISWNMGNCGRDQVAARPFPKGSHGLCPYFYNSAFAHRFHPVPKPKQCVSQRLAHGWPRELRMGYHCDMNSGVSGELFSLTTRNFPFTDEQVFDGMIP